jgi:hypothetical protein
MVIQKFIENFKAKKLVNANAIAEYIKKELEVKDYLPFAEKRELCARVIDACNTKEPSGLVKVDSVSRYIIFTISILTAYTNLKFSSGEDGIDSLDEYDMLCQAGLLNDILDVIGGEYATCNNILNMMMSDVIANNNTLENVVANVLGELGDSLGGLVDVLADKVESMELDLSQINIDEISGLIGKIINK